MDKLNQLLADAAAPFMPEAPVASRRARGPISGPWFDKHYDEQNGLVSKLAERIQFLWYQRRQGSRYRPEEITSE